MDSESGIEHERLDDYDERQAGKKTMYSYTHRTEWIPFGLLALLFILILTLFIIVFSEGSASSKQLLTLREMTDFRVKVHNMSTAMEQLHVSLKKKTCEVGWKQFDDSCYSLTSAKTSWPKARSSCLSKGADLAVITSEREQIFLVSFSAASTHKWCWIGLHDMDEEGSFVWVDGTDFETSYKHWKKGEPDNYKNEDCGHLWTFGEWNDAPCKQENGYGLCEKKL
ncbi:hepatic lectin-like isoform X2 [Dendropsophus ebraccatus]|uniref:hepatic lectin-like isoform X2 n=1 Tax=Dendropsophus ebraccatus TaxID=150705 RepID=UPI003831DB48